MSNIFVTAASGHIGTPLIPLLLKSPAIKQIVLPTTNVSRLEAQVPKSDRVVILDGSIQDPGWVEENFIKYQIDIVFVCLTGVDELMTTCNVFSSIIRSGYAKHLVYLSASGDLMPDSVFHERFGGMMPAHVIVKTVIEQSLQYSKVFRENGRTYTILGPSLFYTNDLRGKETMMGPMGVYGEPIGTKGVSRVDPDDIALAVVKVAENPEKWNGKKVDIGSRELYTEHHFSRLWSEALDKPIKVAPNNPQGLDQLEKHLSAATTPMWGRDIRLMYEIFGVMEFGTTDEGYETQKELLGKEPNSYEEFVRKTGAEWKKELETPDSAVSASHGWDVLMGTTPTTREDLENEIARLEAKLLVARGKLKSSNDIDPLSSATVQYILPTPTSSHHFHSLLLLSDSALPLGSFAFSSGLESYIAHHPSLAQPPIQPFLSLALETLATSTLPYLLAAYRNPSQLEDLDDTLDACILCHVAKRASAAQGKALLTVWERAFRGTVDAGSAAAKALADISRASKTLPFGAGLGAEMASMRTVGHFGPIWAVVTQALGIPIRDSVYVFLLNHAKGVLSAAVRASVVGPYQAQAVLGNKGLKEEIEKLMQDNWEVEVEDAGQGIPAMDLWLGRHEMLYSRIFNS
ncbi:MAG: hypothetical protein Q9219_001713 [cf. Caloplaca sp. 3 TL-2023]